MQRDISNSTGFVLIANNYMAASNESLEDFIPSLHSRELILGVEGEERLVKQRFLAAVNKS